MFAINTLNYTSATKVLLQCKERFWETRKYGIFGGASISDQLTRQTYYPSDHASVGAYEEKSSRLPGFRGLSMHPRLVGPADPNFLDKPGPGVLLASYTLGQDADRLGAINHEERAAFCVANLRRFHPEIADPGMVVDSASRSWRHCKWAAGSFSFLWPRQLGRLFEAATRKEGSVFFAGEHCSTDQGWIQGALIASLRSVAEIVHQE